MVVKGQVSLEQIKALAKDPKFICKKCGRAANSSDNLCEPVELYPPVVAAPVAPAAVEVPAEVSLMEKTEEETDQ
jgi:hypothetical protein